MKCSKAFLATVLLSSLLVSCSNDLKSKRIPPSQSAASQLIKSGKLVEASAMLSSLAEESLKDPKNILKADVEFTTALELNEKDPRANFYSAFTSLTAVTQGFAVRFENFLDEKQKIELKKAEERIIQTGASDLIAFATKMHPNMHQVSTMKDARKFLRKELLEELKNSQKKLENVNSSITLNISDKPITLDEHDLKLIKSTFRVYETAVRIALLFNLDDIDAAFKEAEEKNIVTDKQTVELLKRYPDLFKLSSNEDLKSSLNGLEDVLNSYIEFSTARDSLCTEERSQSALGMICIDDETAEVLKQYNLLLAGPSMLTIGKDEDGRAIEILVNLRAWENSSFQGLQSLLPVSFNKDGKINDVADKTFKGLIPNGDLIEKLKN